ncbi:MAG: 4-diphosphocytidyl-2-C-methyl-D-erythritol kinase [Solirubrobacterales bacterium]|nr:4-diphosphocytidyl-2-C-methyl-D-erythritol kinase [Solirubrobacterales bacterium]
MIVDAPAKLNLCLYLGPVRDDGRHELRSIFEPLALADRIEVTEADLDQVVSLDIEGENLAETALKALRARGWKGGPLQIEIDKLIPIAAGLGGGSADAAAVLRLAVGEVDGIDEIAAKLGADVPSQLAPRPLLVAGAGERLEPIPVPAAHGVVLIPFAEGLDTGEVYAEADRLGSARAAAELEQIEAKLREATAAGASPLDYAELLVNDLQPAALSLRPQIGEALEALRGAGAKVAMVTGSGPTAFGLFEDAAVAERATGALHESFPAAIATRPGVAP